MDDLLTETNPRQNTKNAGGSNVWLSNRHAARPGQQPQQQRHNGARRSGREGCAPASASSRRCRKSLTSFWTGWSGSSDRHRIRKFPDDAREIRREISNRTIRRRRATRARRRRSGKRQTTSYGRVRFGGFGGDAPAGFARANFSAPTLNFAIKELGERGDFSRAHALFLWMRAQGKGKTGKDDYRPNRHTLASFF